MLESELKMGLMLDRLGSKITDPVCEAESIAEIWLTESRSHMPNLEIRWLSTLGNIYVMKNKILSFNQIYIRADKIKILWEDHKIWKNLPLFLTF